MEPRKAGFAHKYNVGQWVEYTKLCIRWLDDDGNSPLKVGGKYAIIDVQKFGGVVGYLLKINNKAGWWVSFECLKLTDPPVVDPNRPLEDGDKVRIVVKPDMKQELDNGYHNAWVDRMDAYVNNGITYTIRSIFLPGSGIKLKEDGEYYWPAGCFMRVE